MTDPRVDAAREWLAWHHIKRGYTDPHSPVCICRRPRSEHPKMLLDTIDAADHAAGIYRVDQPPGVSMTLRTDSTYWTPE